MRINVSGVASEEAAKPFPEGGPYDLIVAKTLIKKSSTGKDMLTIQYKAANPEYLVYDMLSDNIVLPVDITDDIIDPAERAKLEQMNRMSRLKLQDLWKSAGADPGNDDLDTADIEGKIISATVRHKAGLDGRIRANINRYIYG